MVFLLLYFSLSFCTYQPSILRASLVFSFFLPFSVPFTIIDSWPPNRICTYGMSSAGSRVGGGWSRFMRGTRNGWEAKLAFFTLFGEVFLILVFLISFLASHRKSDKICISLYVSNQHGSLSIFLFSSWMSSPHGGGSEGKGLERLRP